MIKLSAVIITFNEEKNIERCLKSLNGLADDIVVVDSFSTDKTQEICTRFPARFISHAWEGYSASKNFGNAQAANDWILSIDADEEISVTLKNSILELKKGNQLPLCSFDRMTNYCGHWVKHGGWYPDTKIRLFDRRNTHWDGLLHEELKSTIPQEVIHLKGDCFHYSYYSIEQHYLQADKFTTIAAQELFEKGKRYGWHKLVINPAVKFIRDYFFKFGFLDGATGFTIARISAYATFSKYSKLRKLHKGIPVNV